MLTAGNPSQIYDLTMVQLVIMALFGVGLVQLDRVEAQPRKPTVDFLNERLKIPESSRFVEAEYIDSGVGVPFGVDKRLSYYSGNYAEAAERFLESLRRYSFKAEIWVYLARSYFYEKKPESARDTIELATTTMPDLAERFWNPLLESMLGEIRSRALDQQAQIDFYTRSQDEYLELFRMFRFLADQQGMSGIIIRAERRAAKIAVMATMVASNRRATYLSDADKWVNLAGQMRGEMRKVGSVPPEAQPLTEYTRESVVSTDVDMLEKTHQLQLKVDFYQPDLNDFRTLFDNYMALEMPVGARFVIDGVDREAARLRLKADTSNDFAEVSKLQEEAATLDQLKLQLSKRLDGEGF